MRHAVWGQRFDALMAGLQTSLCLCAVFALILSAYGWPLS